MRDFIAGFGMLLVVEGVLYSVFPGFAKWLCARIHAARRHALRLVGLLPILVGIVLVWLARG